MGVVLDYNVPDDPRLAEVGFVGFFALVSSLCYSDRNNSDGFVPAIILRRQLASWGEAEPDQVIEHMTRLGILASTERDGIAGFRIHTDYMQWQLSAAQKADRRQKRAEAGRRGGVLSGEARRNRKQTRSEPEANAKQVLHECFTDAEANAKQNEAISISTSRSTEDQNRSGQQTTSGTGFDGFWAVWPKKKAKADAEKAWKKLQPDADLVTRIIGAVEQQRRSPDWLKDGGQFIPHPATWLNGRRWEDQTNVSLPTDGRIGRDASRGRTGYVRGQFARALNGEDEPDAPVNDRTHETQH